MRWGWFLLAGAIFAPGGFAQSKAPGIIVSAGYSPPTPLKVSPGQVITLFVHSPETQPLQAVSATSIPLPTSLNGYSVAMEQTYTSAPIAVPLFSVYPLDNCIGLVPSVCSDLTAITIQVPWELVANRDRSGRPENFAVLKVTYQGTSGESFAVQPETDTIHVINSCDTTMPPGVQQAEDRAIPCSPLVTHIDGKLVTAANPATAGETLTLYAFGLGSTGTAIKSGDASLVPVPLVDLVVNYQVGVNLQPTRPTSLAQRPSDAPAPIYAGLMPGQVGLYQVLVTIPRLPETTPFCTAASIASNFTVSIGRTRSYDGAGICVQTGGQ